MVRSFSQKLFWRGHPFPVFAVMLSLFCYLYVLLRIDPRLHYQAMAPVFFLGKAFFGGFLIFPGGFVRYLSAFLLQCYRYPWLGALIITLISLVICVETRMLIATVSGVRVRFIHIVPAVFLLVLQSAYDYPVVNVGLGLLIALLFSLIYIRMPLQRTLPRLAIFALMSALLYCAVAGRYLVFAVLCGIYELLTARRFAPAIGCFLGAIVVPYVAATSIFVVSLPAAYMLSLYLNPLLLPLALYLFFPVAAVTPVVLRRFFPRKREEAGCEAELSPPTPPESTGISKRKRVFQALAFVAATGAVAFLSLDGDQKSMLQVDYYTEHKMWPQVLQKGRHLQVGNESTIANINRALYHTGRLSYDMFVYPQATGFDVFPTNWANPDYYLTLSDILLELGHVTYAEKWAYEALEEEGDQPAILQRLALIHILKGEVQVARTFLNLLNTSLFDRAWAKSLLARLDADPTLSTDPEIMAIRSRMFVSDYVGKYVQLEPMLELLLRVNQYNRMAFEYLMAHDLLTLQPQKIVENIERLSYFNYPDIPRHYEEAILLYQMFSGVPNLDLHGRQISSRTLQRYREFGEVVRRHEEDPAAARAALAKDYGDTYWYYYTFSRTGAVQSSPAQAAEK